MTPTEASTLIGCSPSQVRYMIRTGRLQATKRHSRHNQHGYEWEITKQDALGAATNRPARGRPRGPRKPEAA